MRVLFAGSPESSAMILSSLSREMVDIVGVISQPDKRSSRRKGKEPSPVSKEALKLGIPSYKPIVFDNLFKKEIESIDFDFLVVSAYGKILPEWLLNAPNIAPINIHFSLLPKYRGASPIQTSILNNDNKTGISIMRMSTGMDEGPVYCFHEIDILESDNKIDLEKKLVSMCIKNLGNDLNNIFNNKLTPNNQNNNEASYCSKIDKLSGKIDLRKESTKEIFQKYKAFIGWPGVYFEKNNVAIKIHGLEECKGNNEDLAVNSFRFTPDGLLTKTSDSMIVITHLQFPGKRIIPALDAANSYAKFFEE
jgi:methionyl-tRNA formyltransferase